MLVFIDDSGDPGFKLGHGSTPVFVVNCVIFDDELEAERTAVSIKELRRKLKKSDNFEFKFNKANRELRLKFLNHVASFKFRVRAIVFDKKKIRSIELKSSNQSFYNYAIKMVLKHNFGTIKNAKLRLDGHGDRLYKREVVRYLRNELNDKEVKVFQKLQFVDSRTNVLIQLTDMIAGSIHRCYQKDKNDAKIYIATIKKRIEDCWNFC
ncbi:MAG: hypothetical protein UV73_C0005G0094 [Candidatus Gottesmanbacteria bacterium GW2011_GWA2_43_14]|uniref:DUF3800 domain-containing protein n=1 Tax=Candidatus Gottesmanbacteria bacterium GW2011_GWA2_43_14 TaxID=1618443 RepID=A0A0G1DJR3_9BACT|nr:MAG: hypothetical protein UV73_C0005G0094 [Candidatus Gottesmanbacteria bacterium GW2011_GWA2_43_14]